MAQKMDRDFPDIVGREKKGQVALRRLYFRAAEGVGKRERRNFPSGPAKRVRQGRIGVEGFFDFRRAWQDHECARNPRLLFYQNSLRLFSTSRF